MLVLESLEPLLERLFRVSEPWGARLSPDGRHLAWIAGNLGETTQLWRAPADGSAAPQRWIANDRDCDWFFWAPDSVSVILLNFHDVLYRSQREDILDIQHERGVCCVYYLIQWPQLLVDVAEQVLLGVTV